MYDSYTYMRSMAKYVLTLFMKVHTKVNVTKAFDSNNYCNQLKLLIDYHVPAPNIRVLLNLNACNSLHNFLGMVVIPISLKYPLASNKVQCQVYSFLHLY